MTLCLPLVPPAFSLEALKKRFVSVILPRVKLHAQIVFRHVQCPHEREDASAEAVALAWKWSLDLARRGQDACRFPAALATYAVRHVKSGRKLCGQEPRQDVLSPLAQARRHFAVSPLPKDKVLGATSWTLALVDNTKSPPDEQAIFRLDFPCWLLTLSERDQRIVGDLLLGHRTLDVAGVYGLSPGRVSQLRQEFRKAWQRFCGEAPAPVQSGGALV